MEGGNPVGVRSRVVAVLVGGVVACGTAFVLLRVLSLLRPPGIGAVVPPPREYAIAFCDLAATLGAAAAGGLAMSRFIGRGGMGQAVVLGVVLLVAFLRYGVNFLNPSWQIGAVILLLLPAVGLGVHLGRTRPPEPAPLGRGIGVVGRIAGGVVAVVGAHRLLNRLSIGFSILDVIEVIALAGLAWLLIRSAAAAPRWRGAAGALTVLSLFAIPVGGLALLLRLFVGLSVVTASAVSPDGRMVVQLADRGTFMFDRNFDIRLRPWYGLWRHVWTSPDENAPHGERFLWSRDGRHVLLLGAKLHATLDSCLASGEFMYLHLDTQTGEVRANTPQRRGPGFTLADLAGIEFPESLVAGVGSMPRFGGPVCEAPREQTPR